MWTGMRMVRVEKLQATIGVFLGDRDDQSKVGLDQFLLGLLRLCFTARDHVDRAAQPVGRFLELVGHPLDEDADVFQLLVEVLLLLLLELRSAQLDLGIEHAVDRIRLALDTVHGIDGFLDLVDQAALDRFGELDLANPS
jgi:hypothetical protein